MRHAPSLHFSLSIGCLLQAASRSAIQFTEDGSIPKNCMRGAGVGQLPSRTAWSITCPEQYSKRFRRARFDLWPVQMRAELFTF